VITGWSDANLPYVRPCVWVVVGLFARSVGEGISTGVLARALGAFWGARRDFPEYSALSQRDVSIFAKLPPHAQTSSLWRSQTVWSHSLLQTFAGHKPVGALRT
jgi:hypothetical protein